MADACCGGEAAASAEIVVGAEVSVERSLLKAGAWYLMHCSVGDTVDVICIDDLRATRITRQTFEPPPSFDLADYWADHIAAAVTRFPERAPGSDIPTGTHQQPSCHRAVRDFPADQ